MTISNALVIMIVDGEHGKGHGIPNSHPCHPGSHVLAMLRPCAMAAMRHSPGIKWGSSC